MKPKPTLGDWREKTLDRLRALINEADPGMIEERKWKKPSNGMLGIPVWSHDGIVCTGETYKNSVKLTFARGAFVKDASGLFNSSLDGNLRRAIDFHEGDKINEKAFKALIKAAAKLNSGDRDQSRFENGSRVHSSRNAMSGSIREARRAGR